MITLPEKDRDPCGAMCFDPMEGVTAVDGKDGDLTGAVQVMGFCGHLERGNLYADLPGKR